MCCEYSRILECGGPVAHIEHWYGTVRLWCEKHTPWSGHYENHDNACADLMQQFHVRRDELLMQGIAVPEWRAGALVSPLTRAESRAL